MMRSFILDMFGYSYHNVNMRWFHSLTLTFTLKVTLTLLFAGVAWAQSPSGLRRLSHEEVVALVSDATVLFASNGEVVHEYHGVFADGVAMTAYRDWDQRVVEGRLTLSTARAGLVCYAYVGDYDNCAYFILDETNGRTYLEFVDTVQQQTVEIIPGDKLNLRERIQIPFREETDDEIL